MPASASLLDGLPPLLTLREAAQLLRVSTKTISRWIAEGRLRSGRSAHGGSGRVLIARTEVQRFLGDELGIAG